MKYRAVLGTKNSYIKTIYEEKLLEGSNNPGAYKLIEMLGGIKNVYSKVIFNDKDDNIILCIGKIERDDEYQYLFFCVSDLDVKDELFGDFTRELTEEEFFEICEEEEIL